MAVNNDEFQQLVKELRSMDVQLPLHKKALRQRILEEQSRRRTLRDRALSVIWAKAGIASSTKKVLSIGAVIVVIGVLVVSLLILLPTASPGGAKKLIAVAAEQVKQMDPEQVAEISEEYEDLNDCLEDAKNSEDTRITPAAEVNTMVDDQTQAEIKEEHGNPDVYVSYTDDEANVVVIALNSESEPMYALNVGESLKADKSAKKQQKEERKEEKRAQKEAEKQDKKHMASGLLRGVQASLD
jgi:hypothetical protein